MATGVGPHSRGPWKWKPDPPPLRPYDGMTDEELLALAKRAMIAAAGETPGTIERAMKWAAYDSVSNELKRRIVRHALLKLNRQLGLPDTDL